MKANRRSVLISILFQMAAIVFCFEAHIFTRSAAVAAQTPPPNICDFCILQFPSTLTAASGSTTAPVFGRIFEAGVTEPEGSSPTVTAQVGYGPAGTDPQIAPGWTYLNAVFNVQVGNDDEYQGTMVAPSQGTYSYVFRFSLDGGVSWSYADLDGAGSNPGLTFDPNNVGVMNVSPSSSPAVATNAATQVTASTAVLNGTANPNGGATIGWFRYSTANPGTCNDAFGTRAPTTGGTALGSGSSSLLFSRNVAGLSSQTTYYFCAIASNSVATSFGSVLSFTTPASFPMINVSPGSISFGDVTVGVTTPSQNVTISNTGTDDLHIGAVTKAGATGDFSIINSPANSTIPPGGSVQFMVTFTPSTAGLRLAAVNILSDDPASPSKTVNLSGNGIECPVTLSMSTAYFEYNGGSGSFNVSNSPPCQWFAVSNVPWITVTGSSSGSGNGTVAYTVAPQNGFDPIRTGTIRLGDKTFTVRQFSVNLPIVQIHESNVLRNSAINVPIQVQGIDSQYGVVAFDATITYDPAVLTYTGFDSSTSVTQFTMAGNSPTPGTIRIAGFGTQPIAGGGDLLRLHFSVIGPIGSTSTIALASFIFNEGSPTVQRNDGSVTVIGGTISGSVTYGTATTITPVPGVTLSAAGSAPVTTLSAADGTYSLVNLGLGSYVVTPSKTGDVNGISAADASTVLQYLIGLASLNAIQQAAADVTGNSTISAFDAAQIARHAVALPDTFLTGSWKFIPSSRSYENVPSDITGENYTGILMGEVTGNWAPQASLTENAFVALDKGDPSVANARPTPGSIKLSLPSLTLSNGVSLIPLTLANYNGQIITSYQFELRYNPNVIVPDVAPIDVATSLSAGYAFEFNASEPGRLRVAVYGVNAIAGNGLLANLRFNVIGPVRSRSDLILENTMLNEGSPTVSVQNGKVTVKR